MLKKLHIDRLTIGLMAVLLCVSGCSSGGEEPGSTVAVPPQSVTTTPGTESTTTTQPSLEVTQPSVEDVPETTAPKPEPTKPQQNSGQTQPTTQPQKPKLPQLNQSQYQPVIDQTIAALASRIPAAQHDASWSGGTAVEFSVKPNLTTDAMVSTLVQKVTELFENQNVECVYSLNYRGITDDGTQHFFEFSYIFEKPNVVQPSFNSGEVITQVTQNLLNSTKVEVTAFDGTGYRKCLTIKTVPDFYSTQEAVEHLTRYIESEIYAEQLLGNECSQFKLAYDGADAAAYTFLLYLK